MGCSLSLKSAPHKNLPPAMHEVPELLNYIEGHECKDDRWTWTQGFEEDWRLQRIGFNFVHFFNSVEAAQAWMESKGGYLLGVTGNTPLMMDSQCPSPLE